MSSKATAHPDSPGDSSFAAAALVYQALARQDYAEAAYIAERNWAYLISYQMHVVRAVADALPEEFLARHPKWSSVRQYLSMVLMGPLRPPSYPRRSHGTPSTAMDVLTMLAEGSIEARSNGNFAEAGDLAAKLIKELDADPQIGSAPDAQLLSTLLYQAGLSLEMSGRENEALAALQRAYANATADGDVRTAANASAELAWCHAMAGHGPASGDWARRHLAVTSAHPGVRMLRSTIHLARAIRLHDSLQFAAAAAEIALATGEGVAEHAPMVAALHVLFDAFAERGDTWDLVERLDAAAAATPAPTSGPGQAHAVLNSTRAIVFMLGAQPERGRIILDEVVAAGGTRLGLARRAIVCYNLGDFEAAERDADQIIQTPRAWPRALVEALVIKAGAALRRSDPLVSVDAFRQAVRVAIENDLLMSLASIPQDEFLRLIEMAYPAEPPAQLGTLAASAAIFPPPVAAVARFTQKEMSVLAELAAGRTLIQAAARLHLSENTVKVHTRAIYRKLQVSSRREAIAEATRRGLV